MYTGCLTRHARAHVSTSAIKGKIERQTCCSLSNYVKFRDINKGSSANQCARYSGISYVRCRLIKSDWNLQLVAFSRGSCFAIVVRFMNLIGVMLLDSLEIKIKQLSALNVEPLFLPRWSYLSASIFYLTSSLILSSLYQFLLILFNPQIYQELFRVRFLHLKTPGKSLVSIYIKHLLILQNIQVVESLCWK